MRASAILSAALISLPASSAIADIVPYLEPPSIERAAETKVEPARRFDAIPEPTSLILLGVGGGAALAGGIAQWKFRKLGCRP